MTDMVLEKLNITKFLLSHSCMIDWATMNVMSPETMKKHEAIVKEILLVK